MARKDKELLLKDLSFYGHEDEELQKEYERTFPNMTQKDKQLLLKEICTRLPYGVICTDLRHGDSKITEVNTEDNLIYCFDFDEYVKVENCRLYLRPMSSMTEEERIEFERLSFIYDTSDGSMLFSERGLDWLNTHHFDFRGLIPMGLALKAPEGMYKTE